MTAEAITREEIAFAREFGPQSPVMKRVIDAAEAHRDEPTRLAAARAKGYREGVAKAEQWCRVQAYCANRREQEADTDRAQTAERIVKQTLNHAADCFLQIASEPPPAKPAQPDGGWIEWKGGECPLPAGIEVEVKYGDGVICRTNQPAGQDGWGWQSGRCLAWACIIAYRIVKPAEPSAPVAPAVEDIVHRYAQEYEWRADEGDHTPTDDERALLEDFGNGLLSEVEGRDRDRITALEAENAALREVVAAVAKHVEGMDLGGSEHDHVCYRVDLRTDLLRRARALLQGQGGGDAEAV